MSCGDTIEHASIGFAACAAPEVCTPGAESAPPEVALGLSCRQPAIAQHSATAVISSAPVAGG
jgi:hypothetical protein